MAKANDFKFCTLVGTYASDIRKQHKFIFISSVASYGALGHVPPPLDFQQHNFSVHFGTARQLCPVISPNILQSVTAAVAVKWWLREYISCHFFVTNYFRLGRVLCRGVATRWTGWTRPPHFFPRVFLRLSRCGAYIY